MKKVLISIFSFCLISSCALKKTLTGHYISKGKDYTMDLTLNKDSSFIFVNYGFEVRKEGKGNWKTIGIDTLLLKFRDIDPGGVGITQNFVGGDQLKLTIASNGKLKYLKAFLKKKD